MAPNSENGFSEYRRSILGSIKDNKAEIKELRDAFQKSDREFLIEIIKLKAENSRTAKIWGLIGGSIPVAIFIALRVVGKI